MTRAQFQCLQFMGSAIYFEIMSYSTRSNVFGLITGLLSVALWFCAVRKGEWLP